MRTAIALLLLPLAGANTGFESGVATSTQWYAPEGNPSGWTTVTFQQTYQNPVVVAGIPSYNGPNEIIVSVKDITSTGFKFHLHETSCTDEGEDVHLDEQISWLVAEEGTHTIGGKTFHAGKHANVAQSTWTTVNFGGSFSGTPTILSQIQDASDADYFVNLRHQNAGASSFEVYTQWTNEDSGKPRGDETVGYLVVEGGSGSGSLKAFASGVTAQTHDEQQEYISLGKNFGHANYGIFGNLHTADGFDPVALRYTAKANDKTKVFLHEDECGDTEQNHIDEKISWLALETGVLEATNVEVRLEKTGDASVFAQVSLTLSGEIELTASNCVVRGNFCGRYANGDCAATTAAVESKMLWRSTDGKFEATMQLHSDGKLSFTVPSGGCVNPAGGTKNSYTDGLILARSTSSRASVELPSSQLTFFSAAVHPSLEPACRCVHGKEVDSAACTSHNDHHCSECHDGHYFKTSKECAPHTVTACGKGTELSVVPNAQRDGSCTACGAGTFQPKQNAGQSDLCQPHQTTTCGKGTELSVVPNAQRDGACTACGDGTFQPKQNAGQSDLCQPHQTTTCGKGMELTVVPNARRDGSCESCLGGTFQPKQNAGQGDSCLPHQTTTCGKGKELSVEPNAERDGSCTTCASGNFQPTSAGTQCTTCTSCSALGGTQSSACTASADATCTDLAGFEVGSSVSNQNPNGSAWKSVTFQQTYTNPVVIAGIPSTQGAQEVVVNVKDVTSTGFKFHLHETSCRDGDIHADETVAWLVAEAGTHTIGGKKFVFGTRANVAASAWTTINFSGFSAGSKPTILSQIQDSDVSDYYVNIRHKDADHNSFQVYTQSVNSASGTARGDETIGYCVVESGSSHTANNLGWVAGITADVHTHEERQISLGLTFANNNYGLFGNQHTMDGGDPAALRYTTKGTDKSTVYVQEESCADSEVQHTTEKIAYFAIETGIVEHSLVPAASTDGRVTCHVTVDNKITSLKYNGNTVEFTGGDGSDWTKTKKFSFIPVAGGKIEVGATEFSNCHGCQCSGVALECTTSDVGSPWYRYGSSLGTCTSNQAGGLVCETTSGFTLGETLHGVHHEIWRTDGAKDAVFTCDPMRRGPIREEDCLRNALAEYGSKVTASRSSLVAGSWNHVPPGCSVQSNGDWAAHFNRKSTGNNDGGYTLVTTKTPTEKECLRFAIKEYGSKVVATRKLVAGSWNHVPPGCSVQSGGDWSAHFNRRVTGVNDGGYTLVQLP